MPGGVKLSLLEQLDGVYAEEYLRETGGAGLTTQAYRDLVEQATGSRAMAEKAATARMAAQMRAGITPQ